MTVKAASFRGAGACIFIFFCISFISASLESGYYYMLPYLEGRGIRAGALAGIVMGICYGVSFVIRPFIPFMEQKIGDNRMLWSGYIFFFLSSLGVALLGRSVYAVIFWRGMAGLGLSMTGVALTAYEREFIPEKIRGRSIALITTAYSLPSLVVVPAMEYLINHSLYTVYICFFPLLTAIGTAAVLRLPKLSAFSPEAEATTEAEKDEEAVSYLQLIKRPQIIVFITGAALFAFTDASQLTFVQLAKELGLPASSFFSVSAGTALVFRLICGKVIDLLPRKVCATGATAVTALTMALITTASSAGELMAWGAVFGIAMGFGYPAFMCLTLDLGGRLCVTRLAVIFGLLYSGLFFLTPVILEFFIGLTGSAAVAYRIIYGTVCLAALSLIPICRKIYKI